MRTLDGGAGGGQLVRTALAVSAVTGEGFEMLNVRGARENPGLRAQHVAAIETVAAIADATTEGVAVGETRFAFDPGAVAGGAHEVDIGTAGSITLVFDAVLPLALRLDAPLSVAVTGGTDVKWSPPFDYLANVKLPVLEAFGLRAAATLDRRGFYPAGGGAAALALEPSALDPISMDRRGPLESLSVHSVAAESLGEASVAERQADAAVAALDDAEAVAIASTATYADTISKGSIVTIVAEYESSRAGFSALGEPGVPSETIADRAVDRFRDFETTAAAVDEHLGDQLVPLLGLVGGLVRMPALTAHVETAIDLLGAFDLPVTAEEADDGTTIVSAPGGGYGTTP